MRILHLLSQLELTGAEAFAVWLADQQIAKGHKAWIISDKIHLPSKATYVSQSIAKRDFFSRCKNVLFLRNFIRENKIEIIHAHSRAASWVADTSLHFFKNPPIFISNIHGRQHLHKTPRKIDVYGEKIFSVCENISKHLVNELGLRPEKIVLLRNGLDLDLPSTATINKDSHSKKFSTITIVGRSSGPKGQAIEQLLCHVIPELLQKYPQLQVKLAGAPPASYNDGLIKHTNELRSKFESRLNVLGVLSKADLKDLLQNSSLVIGSGRVAIQALSLGTPVFSLGEAFSHGIVDLENLPANLSSNFGDVSPQWEPCPQYDFKKIKAEIIRFLEIPTAQTSKLREEIFFQFNSESIFQAMEKEYLQLEARRKFPEHIPVLMYHKIVRAPLKSKHKIFIERRQFLEHIQFLRMEGYTTLTFKEYDQFVSGQKNWEDFPEKPIFLTFDDAYLDNYYYALPFMERFGQKGIIYALGDESIRTNKWDTEVDSSEPSSPLMKDEQLKEFINAGFEIGAHSIDHSNLTKLNSREVATQLTESRSKLESRLNTKVISFAYPYGAYDDNVKEAAKRAGYSYCVATDSGGLHLEEDRYAIFRVSIFPQDNVDRLKKKIDPSYRSYYKRTRGK